MESKYSTLRRPRRKLCYITEKKSLSNQWVESFTYEDVDKMFDDIDVCVPEPHPPSVLFQSSGSGTNYSEASMSPVSQEKHPAEELAEYQISLYHQAPNGHVEVPASSPILNLDTDPGFPLEAHTPIKTSSPIEHNPGKKTTENLEEDDDGVTQIPFNREEKTEEPEADPVPIQKPQCNGQVAEETDDWILEPPSTRIVLTKLSSHRAVVQNPSKDENIKDSVQKVRIEPEVASSTKKSSLDSTQPPAEPSSRVKRDMIGFLKKIQLARKSLPSCSKKTPVKAQPCPPDSPEPEDDFLILEDNSPLWFSIPSKSGLSKKERLRKKSSADDKKSSTDKGTNEGPIEVSRKQKKGEMANSKLDSQAVNQRTKKKKGKEKNREVAESNDDKGDFLSLLDVPADDFVEQEKPNKKKRQNKVPSDESEHQPKGKTNVEPEKEAAQNLKGSTNSLNEQKSQTERSEDVQETGPDDVFREEHQEQIVQETAETDKDIKSEANREVKQDKTSAASSSSSSVEAQLSQKRKRRPPGDWWVSSPANPEQAEAPQPLKKSKLMRKEPSTAVPSTVKNKKDKAPARRNSKEPTKSASVDTKEVKESKWKTRKRRNARDVKNKETAEKPRRLVAELEEQQISDQELDEHSSPLVFSKRDHSLNSRGEFQKVYHHTSTPASQTCQQKEQLRETQPTKRRRKPPGDWWAAPKADDLETIDSQPPRNDPKPQQKGEKRPKQAPFRLGAPKNGNGASKTQGGAPEAPMKPLSAPKIVRRSLATFKDPSVVETPGAVTNRHLQHCKMRNVTSQPSEESADTGPVTGSRPDADMHSGADVDECTQPNQEVSLFRQCQAEDTLRVLKSGPSSMINLEKYDDDANLLSSRVHAVLSVSDFCAYPLKPLILHSNDKENITEWFQSLWTVEADGDTAITPDLFQWYSYQSYAFGIQEDFTSSSFCAGKLLMGSYTKKPLWVDHSATTIFNLLTSSVKVTVDGSVSHYSPGQAFVVKCGQAYSIQNVNAQPSVLYFTRMLAESLD